MKPEYCIYPDVKSCKLCALVNYGMDCYNNPIHGGHRPGAGRKPTGRKRQQIYVTDAEYDKIKKLIAQLRAAE